MISRCGVLGGVGGAVCGEPLLGGDDGLGFGVGGVAFGEHRPAARSASARVTAVWASHWARASSSCCSSAARSSRASASAAASAASRASRAAGVVAGRRGGGGLGVAERGALALVGGGLAGAGEFVADVAGRPRLLPLVARGRAAAAARRTARLLAVGLRAAERAPGGAPGRVGLDLAGLGAGRARRSVVVVAGQFAVARRRCRRGCSHRPRSGAPSADRAERLDGPRGRLLGERRGPARSARGVGGLGERGEVVAASSGLSTCGVQLGPGLADRVEAALRSAIRR